MFMAQMKKNNTSIKSVNSFQINACITMYSTIKFDLITVHTMYLHIFICY